MIKEIKYNGYSANPSDYECADGDLATSIGVIPENGALKPILPPSEVLQFKDGDSVMYIHKSANFKHYIIFNNNSISWWNGSDAHQPVFLRSFNEVYQVTAIGNTLLILSTDGMHYFLWKGNNDGYLYLGTKIPECPLSFGLQGEMVRTDEFSISFDAISEGSIWNEFSDNNKTRITDQVLAHINKFIAERSTNKGKFIFPFFVRYAYRLYDGTLTMHSAPILMIASSDLAPQVFWTHLTGKGKYTDAQLRICGMIHDLDCAVVLQSRLDMLKNWKDIVRSVDVFVSKPIYTYDQNGKCTRFAQSENYNSYCVCKHINQAASTSKFPIRYQHHTFNKALEFVSIGGKDDMDYVKNAKMNELYLQIPVRIAARLPLGKDYHTSLNAGPYIACGVGGKTSGSIPYYHDTGSSDGNRLFKIDTFGNILENNAGNRRLDGGIIVGIAFEYRRLIIGAEAQVGLVKINQQLRQVIDTEEFHNYLPRNFASFFTVGYKFR